LALDEASASSDEEVVAAAVPSLTMCLDGGLLALGSIYSSANWCRSGWGFSRS
jgi:hypothetical protein